MVLILKCDVTMIFVVLLLILCITNVQSVPEEYCFGILDRSDCGLPPTPVFSYNKPGSRCELDTWRGCPSENLFKDEYQCSDLCIGKLFRPSGGATSEQPRSPESPESEEVIVQSNDICYGEVDTNCTTNATYTAFTFNNDTRSCVEVEICTGSNSTNTFIALGQCEQTCLNEHDKWASNVKDLDEDELNKLNDVVEAAEDDAEVEKLKHAVSHPSPELSTYDDDTIRGKISEEQTETPLDDGTIVEAEVI